VSSQIDKFVKLIYHIYYKKLKSCLGHEVPCTAVRINIHYQSVIMPSLQVLGCRSSANEVLAFAFAAGGVVDHRIWR
jgi:hypothetical protein